MKINLNSSLRPPVPQTEARPLFIPHAETWLIESAGFEKSEALEDWLREQPDVRNERVQRASDLIGSPAFPPRETILRLAKLLAIHS
jgi:hypothetical protein